jgi:CRP-like cAMP-binding protein
MHYSLSVDNFEKGAKIFQRGSDCQAIYFLISGELELFVD